MVALVNRKSPVQVLGQSAVAVSHTGNTTETTLATITIPAGAMGANGQVEIQTIFTYTNNANTKTIRHRFGGTQYAGSAATTTGYTPLHSRIANRGATNSQYGNGNSGFVAATGAGVTSAVDTTAAVDITLTAQLGNAADTITLESYHVVLWPKA